MATTTKKPAARRQSTVKAAVNSAHDRAPRLMRSAAAWLKRRGARREGRIVKQAYNEAASLIAALAKKTAA